MAKSNVINILLSVPIAIIFVLFINKLTEILTQDLIAEEKIKKNLLISFIVGIIGILIGWYVFYKSKMKNKAIMIGLFLGSIYLIFNSIFLNWNKLTNDTKLFMIGSVFVALIIISYL